MSYSVMYGLDLGTDKVESIKEFRNSHGTASLLWSCLCHKYWGYKNRHKWLFDSDEFWKLIYRPDMSVAHKTALSITFDYAYIPKEYFKRAADDLAQTLKDCPPSTDCVNHWPVIIDTLQGNIEYPAVGFYWTSCGEDVWKPRWTEDDEGNEVAIPADWSKAWSVYDKIREWETVKV